MVDAWGEAVEADLSDRGQDLLEWFRGRRPWAQLLRLVNHLPPLSHYRRAIADDEDLAAQLLELDRHLARPRTPPLDSWTEWDELNAVLTDGFQLMQLAIAASAGGKPPKFKPQPRPRTASQRVKEQREAREYQDLMAQFTTNPE